LARFERVENEWSESSIAFRSSQAITLVTMIVEAGFPAPMFRPG